MPRQVVVLVRLAQRVQKGLCEEVVNIVWIGRREEKKSALTSGDREQNAKLY